MGTLNGSHSEKQFGTLLKAKHALAIQPSHGTLGYLTQRNENFRSRKCLYVNVQRSFTYNSKKLETTEMCFSEVSTQWSTTQQQKEANYWYTPNRLDGPQGHYAEGKIDPERMRTP